ncbi:hypothetical protein EVAR_19406_1 [Eumeta japonica]|uniref:Uncharacterized protein n=1 Tax=Eumeta variegata TaxID=151549 RepID=A0A4C1TRS2_EUMVA|nr:hypothetical protein EVAR_19406_1 [Eumeta japonica]
MLTLRRGRPVQLDPLRYVTVTMVLLLKDSGDEKEVNIVSVAFVNLKQDYKIELPSLRNILYMTWKKMETKLTCLQ